MLDPSPKYSNGMNRAAPFLLPSPFPPSNNLTLHYLFSCENCNNNWSTYKKSPKLFFELPPPKKKEKKNRQNSMFLIQLWTKMEKALLTQMWYLLPLAIAKTAIAASYPRMPIVQITRCTSSSLWWRWKWCQAIMITTLFMMLVMLMIGMTRMLSEQLIECPSSE